ncbi:MAG: hypothetical protein DMD65_04255 [Gemmatimonadetes bacterium]|nr:MAG: hypothetical protein DMD65_04255 [Gemmatimonadota bacterium]
MTCFVVGALALASVSSVHAQRRFRLGPMLSSLSLEDASGTGHGFTAWGGSIALITGDDGETGLTVARYGDLALNSCERSLTLYALDSYYYPVGTRGVAPFASGELGLARVTDADQGLLGLCGSAQPTSQLAIGFGLGVRVNAGSDVAALVEGRFLQVPNSAIQGLEARANVSLAFGSPHTGEFLDGTLGPAASFMIPIAGSLRGRAPFVGVRFRRDTKKTGSVGLQIDYAPLRITGSCPLSGCDESAVLFAPGYEASARPAWGRLYGELGLLLAGVYSEGPDRGLAQGAHGGIGVDLFGGRVMWNLNSRLLWLQRSNGENVFGVQVGVSVSPRIGR